MHCPNAGPIQAHMWYLSAAMDEDQVPGRDVGDEVEAAACIRAAVAVQHLYPGSQHHLHLLSLQAAGYTQLAQGAANRGLLCSVSMWRVDSSAQAYGLTGCMMFWL